MTVPYGMNFKRDKRRERCAYSKGKLPIHYSVIFRRDEWVVAVKGGNGAKGTERATHGRTDNNEARSSSDETRRYCGAALRFSHRFAPESHSTIKGAGPLLLLELSFDRYLSTASRPRRMHFSSSLK